MSCTLVEKPKECTREIKVIVEKESRNKSDAISIITLTISEYEYECIKNNYNSITSLDLAGIPDAYIATAIVKDSLGSSEDWMSARFKPKSKPQNVTATIITQASKNHKFI